MSTLDGPLVGISGFRVDCVGVRMSSRTNNENHMEKNMESDMENLVMCAVYELLSLFPT